MAKQLLRVGCILMFLGPTVAQPSEVWLYREFDGTNYIDMKWNGTYWYGSYTYCQIGNGRTYMSPDVNEAALGWRAPTTGTVTIRGHVERPRIEGDGVAVRIVKNGQQIWPASGVQKIPPRFMAGHVLRVSVAKEEIINFHVAQDGDGSYDTVYWMPEISYTEVPPFLLDGSKYVIDSTELAALGIPFLDGSLSTIPQAGGNNVWFHPNGHAGPGSITKFSGPLDDPDGDGTHSTINYTNPNNTDGWFWLVNTYKDPQGDWLGFLHAEQVDCPGTPPRNDCKFRVSLAYSQNPLVGWTILGHIVQTFGDPTAFNISGVPYLVKDGYLYVYYRDTPDGTDNSDIAAVARAPLADVMTSARNGTVSSWNKYCVGNPSCAGTWAEPGMGGRATDIGTPTAVLHGDAAYSWTKQVYIMSGMDHGPGRGVWVSFSNDGLSWNDLSTSWVQRGTAGTCTGGNPVSCTLSPYQTIVNTDGTDNGIVGDEFYLYFAFNPRWDDPVPPDIYATGLKQLVRQKVTLFAPWP
jgi:hypothetical protein